MNFKRITVAILALVSANIIFAQGVDNQKVDYDKIKEIAPAVQIYFDLGKSEVKKDGLAKLDKLVKELKSKGKFNLIVTGHTDKSGSDEINLKLSKARAGEVFDYLMEAGVDEEVMDIGFYGSAKPREIEGASAEEKKMQNRRVEILIIEPKVEVPKPPKADTCNFDTTLRITPTMNITMNICEWRRLCQGKLNCITVTKLSTVEEILNAGVPLMDKKGNGRIWAGIYDIGLPGDSCFKEPIDFNYSLDKESYKRARVEAEVNVDDEYLDKQRSRAGRVRVRKTKSDVQVNVPVLCPGRQYHTSKAGRSKETCFKDKTGTIEQIYLVSNAPTTILPARKEGGKFYVKYSDVPDAAIWVYTTEGEWISNIDLNSIKRSKDSKNLKKGYKIKSRHLVMGE